MDFMRTDLECGKFDRGSADKRQGYKETEQGGKDEEICLSSVREME